MGEFSVSSQAIVVLDYAGEPALTRCADLLFRKGERKQFQLNLPPVFIDCIRRGTGNPKLVEMYSGLAGAPQGRRLYVVCSASRPALAQFETGDALTDVLLVPSMPTVDVVTFVPCAVPGCATGEWYALYARLAEELARALLPSGKATAVNFYREAVGVDDLGRKYSLAGPAKGTPGYKLQYRAGNSGALVMRDVYDDGDSAASR